MLVWTDANREAAKEDGWWITAKRWIGRYDNRFPSMTHFYVHIVERAASGSPLHLKVLALLYAGNKDEFLKVMQAVPANQTGALAKTVIAMARVAGAIKGEDK